MIHTRTHTQNLVSLDLFGQKELTVNNIFDILKSMSKLRSLDLSHTKANKLICGLIACKLTNLEQLSLGNCKWIDDSCVDILVNNLSSTLVKLNLDNVWLSIECVQHILSKCTKLKHLIIENFLKMILELYHESHESDAKQYKKFQFETIQIDSGSQISLKEELMEALAITCSNLKKLTINCIGNNQSLAYLHNFAHLNELLLANTHSLLAFSFDGPFLEALKSDFGKQLKRLHLIYIKRVNLKSIAKHCPNLVWLNVEFASNYEPTIDADVECSSSSSPDGDEADNYLSLESLRYLSLSNYSFKQIKSDKSALLRTHVEHLVNHGKLKHMQMRNLNELNSDFFYELFSRPLTLVLEPDGASSSKRTLVEVCNMFCHQNIEKLELKQMHHIDIHLIRDRFFNPKIHTKLTQLNLDECKQITRQDFYKLNGIVKHNNLNCSISWS